MTAFCRDHYYWIEWCSPHNTQTTTFMQALIKTTPVSKQIRDKITISHPANRSSSAQVEVCAFEEPESCGECPIYAKIHSVEKRRKWRNCGVFVPFFFSFCERRAFSAASRGSGELRRCPKLTFLCMSLNAFAPNWFSRFSRKRFTVSTVVWKCQRRCTSRLLFNFSWNCCGKLLEEVSQNRPCYMMQL